MQNSKRGSDSIHGYIVENPYTTILGHMTGRQLLIRPGYPVKYKKVIDACAANNVIIEMNANPYRLDMDWSHIPYALEKGVMISMPSTVVACLRIAPQTLMSLVLNDCCSAITNALAVSATVA